MISGINMADYNRLASVSQSLNGFIREASIAKNQIINSISLAMATDNSVVQNVDVYA